MDIYLGLDYGEKHIGAAVATTFVAEPLEMIATGAAFTRIGEIIKANHITHIVLGLSENQMAEKTKAFAKELETRFKLPVSFHDETLTSRDTRVQLARAGAKRKRREGKIDHYVAATILEDFLDTQSRR